MSVTVAGPSPCPESARRANAATTQSNVENIGRGRSKGQMEYLRYYWDPEFRCEVDASTRSKIRWLRQTEAIRDEMASAKIPRRPLAQSQGL